MSCKRGNLLYRRCRFIEGSVVIGVLYRRILPALPSPCGADQATIDQKKQPTSSDRLNRMRHVSTHSPALPTTQQTYRSTSVDLTMDGTRGPMLIIGAGICGLTLAHGLKKAGIPFEIYERDVDVDARGQGWAITLHWVLPFLEKLLEPEVYRALDGIQVDPEVGRNDTGNFLFINLANGEAKFRIPPNDRRRVGREKMRKLLLEGVEEHVRWGKRLVDISVSESEGSAVTATFEDGTRATGSLLIGTEGTNSPTRKYLLPEAYHTYQLPVRFVGVGINMTAEEVRPLRELDPLLFQGSHPDTGTFLWVSMLEVPAINGTAGTANERFRVQINLSWLVKEQSDEVARTDAEKLFQMQQKASGFTPNLLKVIFDIPQGTPVTQLKLADWPCVAWDNRDGKVTLVGDGKSRVLQAWQDWH